MSENYIDLSDEDYIEAAVREYERTGDEYDHLLIQRRGPTAPALIVERVPGGAWVMAWCFVRDGEV
jgi:hypothetical protein